MGKKLDLTYIPRFMNPAESPKCGDWLKLVEFFALKKQGEYGEEVSPGEYFRFLGLSAAEGYCECYSPQLKSRFWIRLDYLIPVADSDLAQFLEVFVPEEFKKPISAVSYTEINPCFAGLFQQKTKEN